MSFLKSVAAYYKTISNRFDDKCFVFPTRRAGLLFKNTLAQIIDKPFLAPAVYSVEDFVFSVTGFNQASELELVFELFSCYREITQNKKLQIEYPEISEIIIPQETFDTFYPWGELVIKDFDIVDKELVNPSDIFKIIEYEKELESKFAPEITEELREFWGTVIKSKNTTVSQNFLKLFNILSELYPLFTNRLIRKNIAYDGLAYRYMVEHLEESFLNCDWEHFIFVGFNSLNKAEKKIIEYLLQNKSCDIVFDVDTYYLSDEEHEAGFFIRENLSYFTARNLKNAEKILLLDSNENVTRLSNLNVKEGTNIFAKLKNGGKNINVVGTTFSLGAAKVTGDELTSLMQSIETVPEETVIVLADESLLFPLLYSIPESIREINVTMGVSFYTTPLYNLIKSLKFLQEHKIKLKTGEVRFYYKDVEKILMHSYIRFTAPTLYSRIIGAIKDRNIIYFDFQKYLAENAVDQAVKKAKDLIEKIFIPINDVSSLIEYLKNILKHLLYEIELTSNTTVRYDKFKLQYFAVCLEKLQELNSIVQKYQLTLDINTYWLLFDQILKNVRIPFVGEPIKGVQIMGFLETRCLDFKNVFIVPTNENIFPKTRFDNSFIPYRLRKVFNLPTFEEADKIHSYYFYRLIQRAENIFLIYNTEVDEVTKEKSRYILQIEYELAKINPNLKLNKYLKTPPLIGLTSKDIVVEKTEEIKRQLSNISSISVSNIITYIKCPLKFFFTKVAGFEEEGEVEESYSAKTFGSILHGIAEMIFEKYKNKEIDDFELKEIKKSLENNYDTLFTESVKKLDMPYENEYLSGRNYLYKMVILKLLQNILKIEEKQLLPYKLICLEKPAEFLMKFQNGREIKIKSRYDKVIEKDSKIIILDYKTGTISAVKNSIEQAFKKADSIALQGILYMLTYRNSNQENKELDVNVAFYQLKEKAGGKLIFPLSMSTSQTTLEDYLYLLEQSENYIRSILEDIFINNRSFEQTKDLKICSTCGFQSLCHRD
ncbi:MAG: PD-(D/E)XK nuclease family protein [Ignavibacteria bacterium]